MACPVMCASPRSVPTVYMRGSESQVAMAAGESWQRRGCSVCEWLQRGLLGICSKCVPLCKSITSKYAKREEGSDLEELCREFNVLQVTGVTAAMENNSHKLLLLLSKFITDSNKPTEKIEKNSDERCYSRWVKHMNKCKMYSCKCSEGFNKTSQEAEKLWGQVFGILHIRRQKAVMKIPNELKQCGTIQNIDSIDIWIYNIKNLDI